MEDPRRPIPVLTDVVTGDHHQQHPGCGARLSNRRHAGWIGHRSVPGRPGLSEGQTSSGARLTAIAIDSSVPTTSRVSPGRAPIWTGRVLSTLVSAFLLFDVTLKLLHPPMVVEGTAKLRYPESSILVTALLLLGSLVLHLAPRTAVLGAVLLTGYLGGAVATHLRVGDPVFSHTVFPVYVGALVSGGTRAPPPLARAAARARRRARGRSARGPGHRAGAGSPQPCGPDAVAPAVERPRLPFGP